MLSESGGQYCGTAKVLLSRFVDGKSEDLVGSASPFGGSIAVDEFGGKRFVEEPHSFWLDQGFIITESPLLRMARGAWYNRHDVKG